MIGIFRSRGSTLETSVATLRGRHNTSDVWHFANPIVRADRHGILLDVMKITEASRDASILRLAGFGLLWGS